jgi:haloalkane dehalogenase
MMNRRDFVIAAGVTTAMIAGRALAALPAGETDAAGWAAARRFVDLPQGRIAVVERGKGPAALFIHGFPLNSYQWRGALDRLAGARRCIAPDCMGLGYSEPRAGQDFHAPAQAAMLVALMDRLGIGRFDIVANDSGCAAAQLIVADHRSRVRTLLLTNGDNEMDCPPAPVQKVIDDAKQEKFSGWFPPHLADKDLCRKQLGAACFTFPDRFADATIDMYLTPLAANPARTNAYGRAAEGNPLAGISRKLGRSPVPVRIVWGTGDTVFKQDGSAYLDALFPRSRGVRLVPGAKLFFPEEFPDLIAAEARALWQA